MEDYQLEEILFTWIYTCDLERISKRDLWRLFPKRRKYSPADFNEALSRGQEKDYWQLTCGRQKNSVVLTLSYKDLSAT